MNKVFLGIVLAVCILGMLLVMLNDRLGRKSGPVASGPVAESPLDQSAENAQRLETAEARQALGPQIEEMPGFAPVEPIVTPEPPAETEPVRAPQSAAPEEVASLPEPVPAPLAPVDRAAEAQTPSVPEPARETPKPAPPAPPKQEASPRQAAVPPKAAAGHSVTKFVVYSREKGATVRIGANTKLDYSSMTLTNPDRVVVDLPGSWKFPPNPGVPKNDLVSAVRVGQSGDKTRVVIDLKMAARKVVLVPFKSGDGVDVRVDR